MCFLPVARAFACLESVRSSFCASSQASAICAGVARFRSAMRFSSSTIAMFAARASAAKRRRDAAEVGAAEGRARIDRAGQKTRTKRTERDEADSKFLAGGEHTVVLDIARPQ